MIECERVHFHEEVYIPGLGDKHGINNSRSLGNDAPITHRVFFERATGLVEVRRVTDGQTVLITHITNTDVCPRIVDGGIVRLDPSIRSAVDLDITETVEPGKELVYAGPQEPIPAPEPEPVVEEPPPPARRGKGKPVVVAALDDGDE